MDDTEKQRRFEMWSQKLLTDLAFAAPELHREKIDTVLSNAMKEAERWGRESAPPAPGPDTIPAAASPITEIFLLEYCHCNDRDISLHRTREGATTMIWHLMEDWLNDFEERATPGQRLDFKIAQEAKDITAAMVLWAKVLQEYFSISANTLE